MSEPHPLEAALPGALPLPVAAGLQDDLLAAGHDLERLQRLLADACTTLMANFCAADAHLAGLAPAQAAPLRADLHAAVVALQFQDMASQLIAHTTTRLRACADRIAAEALGDEDGEPVLVAPPLRPNPVTQDEMDAGSVELF